MKVSRRRFLRAVAGAVALPAGCRTAAAQAYPARPVRLVVPSAAGSSADIIARLIGQWLSQRLVQQIVVDNRPSAGGNLGAEVAVHAPADGYTLLFTTTQYA